MNIHTPTNCQAANCERVHIGDVVRVVTGGPEKVGFMQYGETIAQPGADTFTVRFPDGVELRHEGEVIDTVDQLTYNESELESMSA